MPGNAHGLFSAFLARCGPPRGFPCQVRCGLSAGPGARQRALEAVGKVVTGRKRLKTSVCVESCLSGRPGSARPGKTVGESTHQAAWAASAAPGAAELDDSYVGMRCGALPGRTAVEYSNTPVSGRIAEDVSGPVYV